MKMRVLFVLALIVAGRCGTGSPSSGPLQSHSWAKTLSDNQRINTLKLDLLRMGVNSDWDNTSDSGLGAQPLGTARKYLDAIPCTFSGFESTGKSAQDKPAGSIRVKSDVTGAVVLLDELDVGRTPLTLKSVAPGLHRLRLIKEGYEDHIQQVEVSAEKAASVFVVMKPLDVRLPDLPVVFKVIHQHRVGYCIGELTITAEALTYRSDNEEDMFHIPICDLKSVARSWGPSISFGPRDTWQTAPTGFDAPMDEMAFRVEVPGRSYGFVAFERTADNPARTASARTRELYEVVYKLWSATLKSKK